MSMREMVVLQFFQVGRKLAIKRAPGQTKASKVIGHENSRDWTRLQAKV